MRKQTILLAVAYMGLLVILAVVFNSVRQNPNPTSGNLSNVVIGNTSDSPVPVQEVNKESKELIMLASQNGEPLKRIFPDGTTPATPFDVPTGKVLVVTDINCSLYSQSTDIDSAVVVMGIRNLKSDNVTWGPEVVIIKPQGITAASSALSLTTGFVVSRQARLTIGTSAPQNTKVNAKVMGYLAPAPNN